MKHLALVAAAGIAALGSSASAGAECATYFGDAMKLNERVQAVIGAALKEKLPIDGPTCNFRTEEWSTFEEKHRAWCAGKDAAAIEGRLRKMSAELAACEKQLDQARTKTIPPAVATQPPPPPPARGANGAENPTGSSSASATRPGPSELGPPPMEQFWAQVKAGEKEAPPEPGDPEVTFTVTRDSADIALVPPNPDVNIQVHSGTWGGNCPGVTGEDDTAALADDCDGYTQSCEHLVDTTELRDPAPGCKKVYVAEWTCGKDSRLRRGEARARPELSAAPTDLFVTLSCE